MTPEEINGYYTKSFDTYIRRLSEVSGTRAAMTMGPALGHMLVANIESVERIKQMSQSPPGACHGNGWASAMDIVQSDLVPKDTAYIVKKPEPFQIPFEPIEFLEEGYKPFRVSTMVGYKYKLGVPRHVIHDCWDVEPMVEWPEPVVPAQPLSWWQWLVIVGVLSWILCALSRAV